MKYTKTKKSILSNVALITAMLVMGSYANANHGDNNKDKISNLKKTFASVENYLSEFVSVKSKTPFNEFVVRIQMKLHNLQRNIEESTRSNTTELSKEIDELMDYALQQFSVLYNVFKKYNGKPESQAITFASEIKKEFDTDKIFSTMVRKLKVLKSKADETGDSALADEITHLITEITEKNKRWNAKGNMELLTGIAHRMKC